MNIVIGGVLMVIGFVGLWACAKIRILETRNIAIFFCSFGVLTGLVIALQGSHDKSLAMGHDRAVSDATIVQKLLRGEEVQFNYFLGPQEIADVAKTELHLPEDVQRKLADVSRYSIRFNTNGVMETAPKGQARLDQLPIDRRPQNQVPMSDDNVYTAHPR